EEGNRASGQGGRFIRHIAGQRRRHQGERGANHPPADVRGEAFARPPEMERINSWEIVAPKAELSDGQKTGEKDAIVQQREIISRREKVEQRDKEERRNQK